MVIVSVAGTGKDHVQLSVAMGSKDQAYQLRTFSIWFSLFKSLQSAVNLL